MYNIKDNEYHRIPLFAQCGDDRYSNVDKMIIKRVEVMPHALINNIELKLGYRGELLKEYVAWLRGRVTYLSFDKSYKPIFHIDVYGTIGVIFDNNVKEIYDYLRELEEIASPFILRIEGPVDAGNREDTMIALKDITKMLLDNNSKLEIVADEWCNTLEDVKYFDEECWAESKKMTIGLQKIIKTIKGKRNNELLSYLITTDIPIDTDYADDDDDVRNLDLLYAVKKNSIEEIKILVANGADIEYEDRDFYTALDNAIINNSIEAVKILLSVRSFYLKHNFRLYLFCNPIRIQLLNLNYYTFQLRNLTT